MLIPLICAILYGIVEGITEWLPVSSTGHLLILGELVRPDVGLGLDAGFADEYFEAFEVIIQLGAILAVAVKYFGRLCPLGKEKSERREIFGLWAKLFVASIPAALVGTLGDKMLQKLTGKTIDDLLYHPDVVAAALIAYGIIFIIIEKRRQHLTPALPDTSKITFAQAFAVGLFQTLAIIPGTSRSGSTILGALTLGIDRPTAAEFSFFMAIPAMFGAGLIKSLHFAEYVAESGIKVPSAAWFYLAVACLTAFLVSLAAIDFLVDFVKKHTFSLFGVYRIILGVAVLVIFN